MRAHRNRAGADVVVDSVHAGGLAGDRHIVCKQHKWMSCSLQHRLAYDVKAVCVGGQRYGNGCTHDEIVRRSECQRSPALQPKPEILR